MSSQRTVCQKEWQVGQAFILSSGTECTLMDIMASASTRLGCLQACKAQRPPRSIAVQHDQIVGLTVSEKGMEW